MKTILFAAAMMAPATALAADDPQPAIEAAMTASAAGWTSGYAPDAVFVTKDGLVRGKAAIAARYDKGYGTDATKRGALSFQMLGHRQISNVHQMLWARWTLRYPGGRTDTGVTSLLFERRPDGWKIISDHSS
jgi:ketosteroid isomerase-like protein